MTQAHEWILLDRDGVINHDSEHYIKTPEEWVPIPQSLQAIAKLTQAGFKIAVITNQSGVGRGYFTQHTLEQIHRKMMRKAEKLGGKINDIFYCPHTPEDTCSCRKPKPGLFHQFFAKHGMQAKLFYIGDTRTDIEAAYNANCLPILVRTGKGKDTCKHYKSQLSNTLVFNDLYEATTYLITLKKA